MEKIDILLATYNGSKYLKEQLDSILSQTFSDFNLIISDDNSSDDTKNILDEYKKKDKRITIYYQEHNLGYIKNFEFLCSKVKSKYCMFSDQDDIWLPEKIESMYQFMISNNSNLVYSDLKVVDKNLNIIYSSMLDFMGKRDFCKKHHGFDLVKLDNVVTGCALMTKKEVIDKSLPFPSNIYVHDWWIAVIASQTGSVDFLDKALILYRQHGDNSIGINSQISDNSNFKKYRNSIIKFHLKQFKILKGRYNLFNDDFKKFIDYGYSYFNSLDINKDKKTSYLFKVYKEEKLTRKIKLLIMFHFPFVGNILFDIRKHFSK